jgi:TolB-like protein/Tfp pilus assembly protein PilF
MKIDNLFAELKRRNVYKVAVAYAVVGWLVVQIASTVLPTFHAPEWIAQTLVALVALGFPIALVLAWAFELTPEGIKRSDDVEPNQSISHKTGRKLTAAIIVVVFFAAALFAWQFLRPKTISVTAGTGPPGDIPEKSIVVLPFENAGGNAGTEYLSDGISEALINSLTELQQLKVVARTTAFRYKGKQLDMQSVGRELKVRTMLMGVVRQIDDRLNVQVDLVDAMTGAQLWGQEYERKVADLLSVKQTIAREVTEKLRLRLSGEQQKHLTKRDTTNAEAYQSYLRGRYYWNKRTAEAIRKATGEFQEAIERDPNYALAHAGLADCYLLLEQYTGAPGSEILPKARAAAARALQIDESLAEAHTSMAHVHEQAWEWAEAEKEYKRAISLNPNYPTAHQWYQNYLRTTGRFDEALAEIKRAQRLDPLSPILRVNLATVYLRMGNLELAMVEAKRLVELDPTFALAHEPLGKVFIKQRKYSEAIEAFQKDVAVDRTAFVLAHLGHAYAVAGRRDEAFAILQELEGKYQRHESPGQFIASVYVGLGDMEQAFAWLEKDFQVRSGFLEYVITNPLFDSIRSDPRYADLLRRMGLQP